MTSGDPPHRLSIIGYWSSADDPPEQSRGLPDPHDLVADWDGESLRATLAHLRKGKVFRSFMGVSSCRMCGKILASEELTDGVWAWPQGLDHYIEAHQVQLPAAFVAASRHSDVTPPPWLRRLRADLWIEAAPGSMYPADGTRAPACTVDDAAWLDWAAENTPARPQPDAISLDEARVACRRLSHSTWTADVDEVMGRWRVRSDDDRMYLQQCSAAALERCLLTMRPPDPANLLDPEQANVIAAEYDGSWGAARVVLAAAEAWVVWVKGRDGEWPTDEDLEGIEKGRYRPGMVTFHLRRESRSFLLPPVDETAWRWLVTCQREEGMKTPEPSAAERLGKALGKSVVTCGPCAGGNEGRGQSER